LPIRRHYNEGEKSLLVVSVLGDKLQICALNILNFFGSIIAKYVINNDTFKGGNESK
jgi:hypothetical protein